MVFVVTMVVAVALMALAVVTITVRETSGRTAGVTRGSCEFPAQLTVSGIWPDKSPRKLVSGRMMAGVVVVTSDVVLSVSGPVVTAVMMVRHCTRSVGHWSGKA